MPRAQRLFKDLIITCGFTLMLIGAYRSAALLHVPIVQARPTGTTFTVTNTNDSGPGSLREAIVNANTMGALKLIGEPYPFEPSDTCLLTCDNHNSVNGLR